MELVTDREHGLFPKPKEIKMRCSCPDCAWMCKHIAAAMYGVGNRLDSSPELLFVLRGVDHLELIEQAIPTAPLGDQRAAPPRSRQTISGAIFDIEIGDAPATKADTKIHDELAPKKAAKKAAAPKGARAPAVKEAAKQAAAPKTAKAPAVKKAAAPKGKKAPAVKKTTSPKGASTPSAPKKR